MERKHPPTLETDSNARPTRTLTILNTYSLAKYVYSSGMSKSLKIHHFLSNFPKCQRLPDAGWNLAGAAPPTTLEDALAGGAGLAGMLALAFSSMASTWSLEVG